MTAIETTPLDLEGSGYGLGDTQSMPERDPATATEAQRLDAALVAHMAGVEVTEVPQNHITTA